MRFCPSREVRKIADEMGIAPVLVNAVLGTFYISSYVTQVEARHSGLTSFHVEIACICNQECQTSYLHSYPPRSIQTRSIP